MRWIILLLTVLPMAAFSQAAATLIADNVLVEEEARLVATGNVEVLYDTSRLSASSVIYDRATDRLQIIGPIFIEGPDGSILTAKSAQLDPQLQNGLLRSARLVLDQQLQLAANRLDRREGRYSQLYKTAVTSCHVCGDEAPLWEIRAERVVHDQQERQLYFSNATFHVRGLPVFWFPRLRLPDPTLDRATGFLIPNPRNSNRLGIGVKIPYFVELGNHKDLTLTPYLSAETRTLEGRYRQAFFRGTLEINAAFSDDTLIEKTRSYIFVEGDFDLGNDYQLDFDLEAASDPSYLLDYSYSGADRLDSSVSLTRVRSDELLFASATVFETLRDDEVTKELPPIVGDFSYERRLTGSTGALTLATSGDFLYRYGDSAAEAGRDMLRLGVAADWRRSEVIGSGLVLESRAGVSGDIYRVFDDPDFGKPISRLVPSAQLLARFPLSKTTQNARHLLEPTIALDWSDVLGESPPNEDSNRPEFEPGNLWALNRFPGEDAAETGFRLTTGLAWTRKGNQGTTARLSFGRIIRENNEAAFTASSGLNGRTSDWLLSGEYDTGNGIRVEARTLFDDQIDFTMGAAKLGWASEDVTLNASYIWQGPDPELNRTSAAAAWALSTRLQLEEAWAVEFDTQYDVDADTPTQAGLGIEWRNECVTVDLSVNRRYTSSTTVEPSTDYGLSVELTGFSTGRSNPGPKHGCK